MNKITVEKRDLIYVRDCIQENNSDFALERLRVILTKEKKE